MRGDRLGMALNGLVVHPTKLFQLNVSPSWFDLNVCLTHVKILTTLIKPYPDMRCNRLTFEPRFANPFLPRLFDRQI